MGRAYSEDLRLRVLSSLDKGMSKMRAHRTFRLSRSTMDDWLALRERTGSVQANTTYHRGKAPCVSDEVFHAFAQAHRGCTLKQMAMAWQEQRGDLKSEKFFSRSLKRIGWTRKKRVFSTASVTNAPAMSC